MLFLYLVMFQMSVFFAGSSNIHQDVKLNISEEQVTQSLCFKSRFNIINRGFISRYC